MKLSLISVTKRLPSLLYVVVVDISETYVHDSGECDVCCGSPDMMLYDTLSMLLKSVLICDGNACLRSFKFVLCVSL